VTWIKQYLPGCAAGVRLGFAALTQETRRLTCDVGVATAQQTRRSEADEGGRGYEEEVEWYPDEQAGQLGWRVLALAVPIGHATQLR
jgi:hypothetical protein